MRNLVLSIELDQKGFSSLSIYVEPVGLNLLLDIVRYIKN